MKKECFLIVFFLLISGVSFAEKKAGKERLDSLLTLLPLEADDSNKVKTLCYIGIEYYQIAPATGIQYGKEVVRLAEKINYPQGIANGYSILACCYSALSNYTVALDYSFKCLKAFENSKDIDGVCKSLSSIAATYDAQSDYDNAIIYLKKAIALDLSRGGTARAYISNMATAYLNKGDLNQALLYMKKDLQLSQMENNPQAIMNATGNIGALLIRKGEIAKGVESLHTALTMTRELGNASQESWVLRWLGKGFYVLSADSSRLELNKFTRYNRDSALRIAKAYTDSALVLSKELAAVNAEASCYKLLYEITKASGENRMALDYLVKFTTLKDTLFNKSKSDQLTQLRMQYEFDKKTAEEEATHQKEVAASRAEIQKQRLIRNSSLAGAMGILLFLSFAYYNFQRRRQLEKIQALTNERLRISRELHDDVGSALGSIALYSDVAINRSIKKENSSDVLLKIGNASRELVDTMNDIIWSMNPANARLEKLFTRMKGYTVSVLSPLHIHANLSFDPGLHETRLESEQLKNLFLLFKEIIYRITIYAECRNVNVAAAAVDHTMKISITDNGKEWYKHHGSDQMHDSLNGRAVLLNGSLNVHFKEQEGTTVVLCIPLAS